MSTETRKHTVCIVKTDTGEVVKESDVTGWSERRIEKLMDGMSINLNWDSYHISERKPTDT